MRLQEEGSWGQERAKFFEQWAALDPLAAWEAARSEDLRCVTGASVAVLKGWAAGNPRLAGEWLQGLPKTSERTLLMDGLLAGWAQAEPNASQARAEWLSTQENLPGLERVLAGELARWYIRGDGAGLAAWLEQREWSPETMETTALRTVSAICAAEAYSAEAMGAWLSGLSAGRVRDSMIAAWAQENARVDAAACREWVKRIHNEPLRTRVSRRIDAVDTGTDETL
ncbi:MAG: hypothetical protein KA004_08575 [Verrucomicrobiales bacterium]|nr:hypothetical protein [Verrucomicrobiales bacterium]